MSANCLLEVCCPPATAEAAFAQWLCDECGLGDTDAKKVAHTVYKRFELAERGTLTALKQSIVRVHGEQ